MAANPFPLRRWKRLFGTAGEADIFEALEAAIAMPMPTASMLVGKKDYWPMRTASKSATPVRGVLVGKKENRPIPMASKSTAPVRNEVMRSNDDQHRLAAPLVREELVGKKDDWPMRTATKSAAPVRRVLVGKKEDRPMPMASKSAAPVRKELVRNNDDQHRPAAPPAREELAGKKDDWPMRTASKALDRPPAAAKETTPSIEAKMAMTKRKLREGYQEAEAAKRQRRIQVIVEPEMVKQIRQRQHPIVRVSREVRRAVTSTERPARLSSPQSSRN